mmetsp:Transcript_14993/g.48667  ORF Transcript_14993/g.48667 Transcript_14993/m.48667 type:complete len:249 (-) Transcript_14993:202-948(-)
MATPRCSRVMRPSFAARRASTARSAARGRNAVNPKIVVLRYFSEPGPSTNRSPPQRTSLSADVRPPSRTSWPWRSTSWRARPRPSSSMPDFSTPTSVDLPLPWLPMTATRRADPSSSSSSSVSSSSASAVAAVRHFSRFAANLDARRADFVDRSGRAASSGANSPSPTQASRDASSASQPTSTTTSATKWPGDTSKTAQGFSAAPFCRAMHRSVRKLAPSSARSRPLGVPSSSTPTRYTARPWPSVSR